MGSGHPPEQGQKRSGLCRVGSLAPDYESRDLASIYLHTGASHISRNKPAYQLTVSINYHASIYDDVGIFQEYIRGDPLGPTTPTMQAIG